MGIKLYLILLVLLSYALSSYGQRAKDGERYKEIEYENGYDHNKWRVLPEDHLFKFRAYMTSFDGDDDNNGDGNPDMWGIPEWVTFEVRKKTQEVNANRPSSWLSEESLYDPTINIAPKDASYHVADTTKDNKPYSLTYNLSRGHMCPKNIANRMGANADYNTHTVLNACPQYQWFNNGIWKDLERLTENWADEYEKLWVICGPIIHKTFPQLWLGEQDKDEKLVAVPDAFFKIIIRENAGETLPMVIAFIYPHAISQSDNKKVSTSKGYPHDKFIVSVHKIEELTNLNFFTNLSKSQQDEIELHSVLEVWEDPGKYNLLE